MKNFDLNKLEELVAAIKVNEILNKKPVVVEEKKDEFDVLKLILIILGVVFVAGVVAYGVYKFLTPDYLEDFDDDFDDDFDEDFFDDEEDIVVNEAKTVEE